MHTVLIPYDYSASAKNAAVYALALFAHSPTKFVFAHFDIEPESDKSQLEKQLSNEVEEIAATATHAHHKYEQQVGLGDATKGVVALAKASRVDAIVMGAKGSSDIRTRIMGNTTSGVIELATVPLLAIPTNTTFKGYRKIALATDYKPVHDFGAYDYLMNLLSLSGAAFVVVNVERESDPVTMAKTMAGVTMDRKMPHKPQSYDFVSHDSAAQGIQEYCKDYDVDLLAMLKRDHYLVDSSMNDSIVGETLQGLKAPLLSLPY